MSLAACLLSSGLQEDLPPAPAAPSPRAGFRGTGPQRVGKAGDPDWGSVMVCSQLSCVRRESGNSSWEIPRASKAEEGTYECTAVSKAGTGLAQAQVIVTGLSLRVSPPHPLADFSL